MPKMNAAMKVKGESMGKSPNTAPGHGLREELVSCFCPPMPPSQHLCGVTGRMISLILKLRKLSLKDVNFFTIMKANKQWTRLILLLAQWQGLSMITKITCSQKNHDVRFFAVEISCLVLMRIHQMLFHLIDSPQSSLLFNFVCSQIWFSEHLQRVHHPFRNKLTLINFTREVPWEDS